MTELLVSKNADINAKVRNCNYYYFFDKVDIFESLVRVLALSQCFHLYSVFESDCFVILFV